jgi:protoporphyrinogen/coproporphyrinogen III oxidase
VPLGTILLRVFFRPTDEELTSRDETGWIDVATRAVAAALDVRGAPVAAWASIWPRALPVYDAAFRAAVERADAALSPLGIRLAGSHFHGAGIDAAIASAERAAAALLGD